MGYNSGVICAYLPNPNVIHYLHHYLYLFEKKPGRAPVILWKAAKGSGIYPYVLPEQWLVMGVSAKRIFDQANTYPPMLIHAADKEARCSCEKYMKK